jgi:hypothetical protein
VKETRVEQNVDLPEPAGPRINWQVFI